ncbi:MAG: hypothetical protein A2Y34_07100 [Spirochaetes bacterium GWC1_27_15]|nr:MAG: hypothetical protein A2Y34_07100 [Spirochaetes bacterium GWC1_27_15]
MDKVKEGSFLWVMQQVAQYKSALASCAIEGNEFGKRHLKAIEGMELVEEYKYLKKVFDYLEEKYN